MSGCSQNATVEDPNSSVVESPNESNPEDENPTPDAIVNPGIGGYTATLYFNSNTTGTVSNMPSTTSVSSKYVMTTTNGWMLSVTIPSNIPTRSGYTFVSWNTSSTGSGTSYDPGDSCGVNQTNSSLKLATKTLYAIWKQNVSAEYKVTLYFDDNTTSTVSNMPSTTSVSSKYVMTTTNGWMLSVTIPSNVPTRSGYTFLSWNTNSSGTGSNYDPGDRFSISQSSISIKTASATLYAKWQANTYTISFFSNGGSGSMTNKTIQIGSDWFSVGHSFYRTGYEFIGWTISGMDNSVHYYGTSSTNYTTTTYTSITHTVLGVAYYKNLRSSSGTVYFYARWARYAIINYEFNGSENPKLSITNTNNTADYIENNNASPGVSAYVYWEYDNTGGVVVRLSLSISSSNNFLMQIYIGTVFIGESSNKTLSFEWTTSSNLSYTVKVYQKYTVSYNTGGGSVSPSSKEVTYLSTYGDLPTASKPGYNFAGWWTSSSGGSQVLSTSTVNTASNHSIYAHWNANVFTVDINILNPNGVQDNASGTMTVYYSYSGNTYNNVADQPESSCAYLGTIVISNIQPTAGYYLSSVICGKGKITQSGSTYTYTATMTSSPSGSWDDTISIYMAWNEFPVEIKIVNMYGEENGEYGNENGTMDLLYSDGVSVSNAKSEYNLSGSPKKLRSGWTIKISNIIPASSFQLKSVSADRGSLVDNKDGSYTFTVNYGTSPNGTTATITIQMTPLLYDEDEGYFYMESGEYPQSYAAVEWDEYSGDGNYSGANISYNKNTKVLTIDGTMTGGTGTILKTHGITFTTGNVYTVYREYIGGSFSIQNNTGTSMVIDTITKGTENSPSTRNNNDAGFGSYGASNVAINQASIDEADGFKFWIWLNGGTTATFDNYQMRIFVCYDNILNNSSLTSVGTIASPADNSKSLTVYKANNAVADAPSGTKFVQLNNRWFKVEPIKWKMTDFATNLSITTSGGWEIIGQAINVRANTNYTLKLNYSVPNYTPLSGYNGLAFMVLSSSPSNDDCKSKSLSYCELPTQSSSGEIKLQFNSGSYTTIYVVFNFGYIADGATYKFKFGYLRISDDSLTFERDVAKWNKYTYSNAFSISEDQIVSAMGLNLNDVALSDKILTLGAVESDLSAVKEGWSFINSDLYSMVDSLNSFMNAYSDMWTIYYERFGTMGQQDKVMIDYDVFYDATKPWVASVEEVYSSSFASAAAKGSDLVCFILGCNSEDNVNYWTRNLGSSLDNGKIITKSGSEKSNWLNKINGVRLATIMHW